MTHWTAPQEPTDRRPKAGDTIESEAALLSLKETTNGLVVRDTSGYHWAANRTFVVWTENGKRARYTAFKGALNAVPTYPLTVLWSEWDDETEVPF